MEKYTLIFFSYSTCDQQHVNWAAQTLIALATHWAQIKIYLDPLLPINLHYCVVTTTARTVTNNALCLYLELFFYSKKNYFPFIPMGYRLLFLYNTASYIT